MRKKGLLYTDAHIISPDQHALFDYRIYKYLDCIATRCQDQYTTIGYQHGEQNQTGRRRVPVMNIWPLIIAFIVERVTRQME